MATIATRLGKLGNLIKQEVMSEHGYCRAEVTVNEAGAETYAVGTVLGKITVSGKYIISVETAVDGSEDAAAIVIDDYTIAATTDTGVAAIIRGPIVVGKAALILDATYDDDTKKAAAYASLEALGIKVADQY